MATKFEWVWNEDGAEFSVGWWNLTTDALDVMVHVSLSDIQHVHPIYNCVVEICDMAGNPLDEGECFGVTYHDEKEAKAAAIKAMKALLRDEAQKARSGD